MKICQIGAELFYADRWTDTQRDIRKLIVAFRNFAKEIKKVNCVFIVGRYFNIRHSNFFVF